MSSQGLPLRDLQDGESALVLSVGAANPMRRRLLELGLVRGAAVNVVRRAPLGDPIEIRIGSTHLALRAADLADVLVTPA